VIALPDLAFERLFAFDLTLAQGTRGQVRADFERGAWSSDCGPLLLHGVDRQSGLTERLTAAIHDARPLSSIDHPLRDLLAQRIYQIALKIDNIRSKV
jgi:hypothetical protein